MTLNFKGTEKSVPFLYSANEDLQNIFGFKLFQTYQ